MMRSTLLTNARFAAVTVCCGIMWLWYAFVYCCSPTPHVSWRRVDGDGQLPVKATVQSFGQELMITDADASMAGTYECIAVNRLVTPSQQVTERFQLAVECKHFCQLFYRLGSLFVKHIVLVVSQHTAVSN